MTSDYHLRPVRSGDAAAIARHRARMFREMGEVSEAEVPPLEAAARAQLEPLIDSGEYFGWVIEVEPGGEVVSGAGVFLHRLLPRGRELGLRQEAYVLNVYSEPAHRRRGLSRRLMEELVAWCRAHGITRITLHASDAGRPVYEGLGFTPTNEMRLVLR
jgi:GNAT superfamily N-acetyltransferase